MFFLQCFHLKLPRPLLHIRTGLVLYQRPLYIGTPIDKFCHCIDWRMHNSIDFSQNISPGAMNALRDDHKQVFVVINRRTVPRCPFSLVWTCWVSSCVRRPMTVSPFPSDGPERRRRQMPPSQLLSQVTREDPKVSASVRTRPIWRWPPPG